MAKILLTWELGGGLGHLVNLRPLAIELCRRGHSVFAALQDVTRARRVFDDAPVQCLQAPMRRRRVENEIIGPRSYAHLMHNNGFNNVENIRSLSEAWRHVYEYIIPDAVVYDYSPMAMFAMHALDAAKAQVGTGFFSPPRTSPLPDIGPPPKRSIDELRYSEDLVLSDLNRVNDERKEPPIERLADLFSSLDADFLATFAELDHYPQRSDGEYFGAWPGGMGVAPEWPDGEGPRIFAYLKPFEKLSAVLKMLRDAQLPTLVYVDALPPRVAARFESPLLRFVRQPLELSRVGGECALAILNGNHGATVSMLLAGAPTLQIPRFLEQTIFSLSVVRLGAGLAAAPTDAEGIDRCFNSILSDGKYRAAAGAFAERYRDYDGGRAVESIIARVEELAAQSTSSKRSLPRVLVPSAPKPQVAAPSHSDVQWTTAERFVHARRFDVAAKHLFARHREYQCRCDWPKQVYLEHIRVFNGFHEQTPPKHSADDFVDGFVELLDDVKRSGFRRDAESIPVAADGVLLNGAHRVAASLLHGTNVAWRRIDRPSYDFSASWFGRWTRNVRSGLAPKYADAIAMEYCRLQPRAFLALAFPGCEIDDASLWRSLGRHARIVYAMKTSLGEQAVRNLEYLCEQSAVGDAPAWIATAGNRGGKRDSPLRVVVCEATDERAAIDPNFDDRPALPGVRMIARRDDSLRIAGMLLQPDRRIRLERMNPARHPALDARLGEFLSFCEQNRIEVDCLCIDGAAAHAILHGEPWTEASIEFFASDLVEPTVVWPRGFERTRAPDDDVLFDPRRHIHFRGLKVRLYEED